MTPRNRLDRLVGHLQADPRFIRNVTAWRTLPSRQAYVADWPRALNARLLGAAERLGIAHPYTHQVAAIESALRGANAVIATGTASGKTLGYVLPVLNTLLQDPNATALLLYPTKALAHDQISALERWIGELKAPIALRPYDGDTPQRQRAAIRKEARILVTNPDMLHLGILPHHTQWMRFFQGLRYVVLDELHTYRGVFGSHVANVLRRLQRVAGFYGAAPQCLAASATIANPQSLAEQLWEAPVSAIDVDGAAYGTRHVLFYNPPLIDPALGLRASAYGEALSLAERLLEAEVQTIIFARSRLSVELLLRELRARAQALGLDPATVQGYRGGYLPQERRVIELGLRNGSVRTVVATNALELGIDIGALDASILVGYPGTLAATRQQMGRAGRRAGTSLSVLVATPSPLDQYLVSHPEYFFGRSPEEARINADGLSLLVSHLTCAAFELPFQHGERFGRHVEVDDLLEAMAAEGLLHRSRKQYSWVGESYPAQMVSLRTATAETIVVRSAEAGVIGTVDRPSAPLLVHEGAVYLHGGVPYLIESLDWDHGIALARAVDLDYYTVASMITKVERREVRRRVPGGEAYTRGLALSDEAVVVHARPTAYRRVHLHTRETLGWGEIRLPEQQMETEAFRLTLGPSVVDALAGEGTMLAPLDYGPEWPEIRGKILDRDGHQCRLCGERAAPDHPLEVHHLTPLRAFLARYTRPVARRLAHAPENLLSLCPVCHRQVERARGARTALSGLAYLLQQLAPVFLMCDPGDLGTSVEARDRESGQPVIIVYDGVPGGVGLTPRLVDLWPKLAEAAWERVTQCPCREGCPSCVGPTGESDPGAKQAAIHLLEVLLLGVQ
ncbi:MAG: DEAD/DEAH box helicase [Anaerolineae bacterium]|nr:DEAD/DEAH box helicase [Anaerolineae bacterium]